MPDGVFSRPNSLPNKPSVVRGAFVEVGLSLPPLMVAFQFNPLQLTRNRSLTFDVPSSSDARTLRQFHSQFSSLLELQKQQLVTVEEQAIRFDIRLDATDKLNERDAITQRFGIAPQIATLELMTYPKDESLIGTLLAQSDGYSFTRNPNPPLVLFIFGRRRVLPVNIKSMNITETEFSVDLNPIRATVTVTLTVIEGKSKPYIYTKAMTEAMSVLNLANSADIANVVIPR